MTVRVVTDSTSDTSPETAQALDVAVVPIYVRFGEEVYRHGVEISSDESCHRMAESPIHPATLQPAGSLSRCGDLH